MTDQAAIPLIEIHLAEPLRFSDRDLMVDGVQYTRRLVSAPTISASLSDLFFGTEEVEDIDLVFSDPDDGIDAPWTEILSAYELRGALVSISEYTESLGKVFLAAGVVSGWTRNKSLSLRLSMRRDAGLETLIPKHLVTADRFHATAKDVGAPVSICVGYCYDVSCPLIRDDVSSGVYDYLIGYGPIQGVNTAADGCGVKRDGVLVGDVEWVLLNSSTYPGYAVIRFSVQQKSHSGGYHAITADVIGLKMGGASAQRNFALVIGNLLSNTAWGLSQSIDATSFTAAAAAIPTTSGFYCDGCVSTQKQARDYLDELMFPFIQIERGASGWGCSVDAGGKSSVASFDEEGAFNPAEIYDVRRADVSEALRSITLHYGVRGETPSQELTQAVSGRSFGVDKSVTLPFVVEHDTAKKILSYLHNRSLYSDLMCAMRTGIAGRALSRGDVVTLYKPEYGVNGALFIIEKAQKSNTEWLFDLRAYDEAIFGSLTITTPTAWEKDTLEVSEPNTLIGTVSLGDGADNVGTLICSNASGQKVGMTAAGTGDDAVRLWGGATFENRSSAPFRMTEAGKVYAEGATISGELTIEGTKKLTVDDGGSVVINSTSDDPWGALVFQNDDFDHGWEISAGGGGQLLHIGPMDTDSDYEFVLEGYGGAHISEITLSSSEKVTANSGSVYLVLDENAAVIGKSAKILIYGEGTDFQGYHFALDHFKSTDAAALGEETYPFGAAYIVDLYYRTMDTFDTLDDLALIDRMAPEKDTQGRFKFMNRHGIAQTRPRQMPEQITNFHLLPDAIRKRYGLSLSLEEIRDILHGAKPGVTVTLKENGAEKTHQIDSDHIESLIMVNAAKESQLYAGAIRQLKKMVAGLADAVAQLNNRLKEMETKHEKS